MQKLAAGRSAEEVARELHVSGWQKATADAFVERIQQDWQQIEAAPQANAGIYLQIKYPEMRPVSSMPSMFSVHGIGTVFYGSRDLEPVLGTYVTTQCFCFILIPIFALQSFRVARHDSGYAVIGKVPLSRLAKAWNLLIPIAVSALIGFGLWDAAANSPDGIASRKLARADEAAAAGKLQEASRLYGEVARTHTDYATLARQRFAELIERPEIDGLPMGEVTRIFDELLQSRLPGDGLPAAQARGLAIVKRRAKAEPATSMVLLGRVARLSSSEACKTFADLFEGPLAALPPAETVAVFREASAIPQDAIQKAAFVGIGVKQCRRLAVNDLPSAAGLLAVLAPLGDQRSVDDCLTELSGQPLEKASCGDVVKVLRVAKGFSGAAGEKALFQAGIAWVRNHAQVAPREIFELLDQLAKLPASDRAVIAATRRPLLEKLVAANPQDVELIVQLALTLEEAGSPEGKEKSGDDPKVRIIRLLSPHRDKLGTGEGARLLGQALAAQGKFDESYALLGPYLDSRLGSFHEAEQAYADAIAQVNDRVMNQFRSGDVPGFDLTRARAASEKEFQVMAMEYMNRQIKGDPAVEAAREKLAKQGMVVPAALDLGMVMLQRAQTMKDPAARRQELERAEKTFLAIRGTAGESDQYMLRLGQVYYWLGKQKEGQEEFDKLLAKYERKAEVLFELANVLRDLGARAEARKLLEEAYEKAPSQELRQTVAELRAITATELDEEILWLDRSDASSAGVKALLASARGKRAANQGNDDEAAARFREAIAIYEQLPQDVATLNNGALVYLALFEITGDHQAMERGAQWLEKAVNLDPADSKALANAAHQMLRAAVQDLAGTKLNLRELQMSGQIGALTYLAGDQKGLDEIRTRARAHAGLKKALSYLDRANLLSPKDVGNDYAALVVYGFLQDREALQRLARQVAAAKPDTESRVSDLLKYYQYKDEESTQEKTKAAIGRAKALVARSGGRDQGPAYAAAADRLVQLNLSCRDSEACDADEAARLAEDAFRVAPSLPTFEVLVEALMHRAGKKLATDYPEFASAIHGTGRAASARYAVALAMERNDALGKSARENRDVQRAIELVAAQIKAFPTSRSCWAWAVLGAASTKQDDLRAKCLVPDDLDEIKGELGPFFGPLDPDEAFESYWRRKAAGSTNAREPLDRQVKLGVPLPVSLIQTDTGSK